ncbi:MAG: hypothetical protein ABWK05_06335 [Pyrobaculum sp.]
MDLVLLEARYQRAVFNGGVDTIVRDFRLRYGDRWSYYWEASADASEGDVKAAEKAADALVGLVESRVDDVRVAALYAAYGRSLSLEGELGVALELLGAGEALEKLLRWGLVMHFSDDVVASPPYLVRLLIKLGQLAEAPGVDLWEELRRFAHDGASMAFLEGLLAGEFDAGLHAEVYGEVPKSLRLGVLASYVEEVGLVVNPVFSADEVLGALLEWKKRRADAMAKALALHGEYEFSQERRCGLQYLSVDGTAEKSGVVALCPWLSYSKRLWRIPNLVVVVEGGPPPRPARRRHGLIFMKGGEAYVAPPDRSSKLFEYVVDLLYSQGFSVSEL